MLVALCLWLLIFVLGCCYLLLILSVVCSKVIFVRDDALIGCFILFFKHFISSCCYTIVTVNTSRLFPHGRIVGWPWLLSLPELILRAVLLAT